MPHYARFSNQEIDLIKNSYSHMTIEELSTTLGRTPKSVRAKCERLGIKLSELSRNQSYFWSEQAVEFIKNNFLTMTDSNIATLMGVNESLVCRKRLELGLKKQKKDVFISNGYACQYIDRKRIVLHRHVVEKSIGRKLLPLERVHHIDGDKTNYDISNLYLCSGRSSHMLLHSSLEKTALQLVKNGLIKFNHSTGEYHL